MTQIFVSETISNFTVEPGDQLIVVDGGEVDTGVVSSGGLLSATAGIVTSATILSGGSETIANDASASFSTISSGGYEIISGGSETSASILGGVQVVANGLFSAGALAATIFSGGVQSVGLGGTAGITNSTTVSNGGLQYVSNGITSNTTILSGGTEILSGFSVSATSTMVSSGGIELLYSGAVDIGGKALAGGAIVALPGAVLSGTTGNIVSTGVVNISNNQVSLGSVLSGATLGSSQQAFALQGGSLINDTFLYQASGTIGSGGSAVDVTLAGGALTVSSGGAATGTVLSSVLTSFGVYAGGNITISSGGAATGTIVNSGTGETVTEGGSSLNPIISAGGTEGVLGGAAVTGAQVAGYIGVDGTVIGTVVSSGGAEVVNGSAIGTTVLSGGVELVNPNGVASNTVISSGGIEFLYSGAIVSGLTLQPGATLYLLPGAAIVAPTTPVSAYVGNAYVYNAGTNNFTSVQVQLASSFSGGTLSGGNLYVSGGSLINETIIDGNVTIYSGSTVSGNILSNVREDIQNGAVVKGETLTNFATQTVEVGAVASGTIVSVFTDSDGNTNQAAQYVYGVAVGTVINGGSVSVNAGGSLVSANLISGSAAVFGTTTGTTVRSGATENINGGVASGSVVLAGGTEIISGTGSIASGTKVYGTEIVRSRGVASSSIVQSGGSLTVSRGGKATSTTILSAGTETILSAGSATNTVISNGGNLVVSASGVVSGTSVLSGGVMTLLGSGTAGANTFIAYGGSLDLQFRTYNSSYHASFNADTNQLIVTSGATTVFSTTLTGSYDDNLTFSISADTDGSTIVTENPCYCPGTLIATERGDVLVEDLVIGDRLLTYAGEMRAIKWIGRRSYTGRFILSRKDILPICFAAGSIADNIPVRDLWVSPHHAVYLDGLLIEAKDLVNDVSIYQADAAKEVTYFHLELDSHDVILAEGAWAESYIEDNNRGIFHNAHEYVGLYPDEKPASARYYAPRIDNGHEVECVRGALNSRIKNSYLLKARA